MFATSIKFEYVEFIRLNSSQVMSIIASTNGQIENRIIEDEGKFNESILREISNFLNFKYKFSSFCLTFRHFLFNLKTKD